MERFPRAPVVIFSLLVSFYGFDGGSALRPQYLNYHPDTGFTPLREQRQIKFRDTFQDLPKSIESFLPERKPTTPVKTYVILKNSSQIQQPRPILNNQFSNLPTYFPVSPSQTGDAKPEPHPSEQLMVSKPSLVNVDFIDDIDYNLWGNDFLHQSNNYGSQTTPEQNIQYATDNEQFVQKQIARTGTVEIEDGPPTKTDANSNENKNSPENKFGDRITTESNKRRGNKKSVKINKKTKAKPTNGINKYNDKDQNNMQVSQFKVQDQNKGSQVFETKYFSNKDDVKKNINEDDNSRNYVINNGERINSRNGTSSTKLNPRNEALKSENVFDSDNNENKDINKNTKRASTHNDIADNSEAKLSGLNYPSPVTAPVRLSPTEHSRSHIENQNDFLAPFNSNQFENIATVPISAPFRPSPEDQRLVRETFSSYSSIDESDIPSTSDNIRLDPGKKRLVSSNKKLTSGTGNPSSGKSNFNIHMGSLVKSFQLPVIPAPKTKISQQDPTRFDFVPRNKIDRPKETLISQAKVSSSVTRKVPRKKSFNKSKGKITYSKNERAPNNNKQQNNKSRRKNVNSPQRNTSDKSFNSGEEDSSPVEYERKKKSGSYATPRTSFKCPDPNEDRFYADKDFHCMVFHRCYEGRKATFGCPKGTRFSEVLQVCVWKFMVVC